MSKIYDVRQKNTETAFKLLSEKKLNLINLNKLIQNGGLNPNAFEDDKMFSLFGLVVMKGDTEMVEMLIKVGADVNLTNEYGEPPLFNANANVSRILLKYGANVKHKNDHGETVLMYADDPEKLQLMIDNGADIKATCNSLKNTPLHLARDVDCVKVLIKNGADVNVINDLGETPLECHLTNIEILKVLLDNGAKITKNSILAKLILDEELRKKVKSSLSE